MLRSYHFSVFWYVNRAWIVKSILHVDYIDLLQAKDYSLMFSLSL